MILFLLKEQGATAETVRLRRISHQSVVLKPTAQLDNMIDTLAWERDIDLTTPRVLSTSNQNLNLSSTMNTADLNPSMSRPPSPPPPQFVSNDFPTPSSVPQRLTGDRKLAVRSELSELRSRPSFVDYEDLEVFRHMRPLTHASNIWHPQPIRRVSMMPVDADGYKDLLLAVDYHQHRNNHSNVPRDQSNTSIKSKTSETTIC